MKWTVGKMCSSMYFTEVSTWYGNNKERWHDLLRCKWGITRSQRQCLAFLISVLCTYDKRTPPCRFLLENLIDPTICLAYEEFCPSMASKSSLQCPHMSPLGSILGHQIPYPHCRSVHTDSGSHTASYSLWTEGSFPGGYFARAWSWQIFYI
jgi:hypothetical protein